MKLLRKFWLYQYLRTMGRNFGVVNKGGIFRGALPDDYAWLEAQGVSVVINLIEGDQSAEEAKALAAGIRSWVHIPMSDKAKPADELAERFLAIMNAYKSRTIYIHCKGGRHRTGVLVALWRVRMDGWTFERAYEEMLDYGWYSAWGHGPLLDWIKGVIGK